MDILNIAALIAAGLSLPMAATALYLSLRTRKLVLTRPVESDGQKNEIYADIAGVLSDGAMIWQRMIVHCDELAADLSNSMLSPASRDTVGDWLMQLRDFNRQSKVEVDQAYQSFATEAKRMTAQELELQLPDMEKFNKEMKSNVAVISDQLEHLRQVISGQQLLGNRQLRITLHKPQVMPHFLRKRQKIAELQRRRIVRTEPTAQPA